LSDTTKKTADGGKDVSTPARRGGVIQFFTEVRREVSKVTWPSWKETYLTTIMVFIMVVITMVFFAVVDYGLGIALNFVLGIR
jgi:preprotein translocase subunit SecE